MSRAALVICVIQGLVEVIGPIGFVTAYVLDSPLAMVVCGLICVIDDVIEILQGLLNPLFPIFFAVVLAAILTPWYVGVFWASAGVKLLGVPGALRKIAAPRRHLSQIPRQLPSE